MTAVALPTVLLLVATVGLVTALVLLLVAFIQRARSAAILGSSAQPWGEHEKRRFRRLMGAAAVAVAVCVLISIIGYLI